MRRMRLTASAREDVARAVDFYVTKAGSTPARRFLAAFRHASDQLARQPGLGSLRWGRVLEQPGLRSWPLGQFPYVLFYAERDEGVVIVRVLHERRELSSILSASSQDHP